MWRGLGFGFQIKNLFKIPGMKNPWRNLSLYDKFEIKGLGLGFKN
jgi:hypothetical protein